MLGNTIPEEGEASVPVITYETPTLDRGRSTKESSPPLTRTMSPDVPRIPLGGRRRSFVPGPVAPPVDPGSETAAYVQRLEDERNQLRDQLRDAQDAEKRSAEEVRLVKNQLALRSTELEDARSQLSHAEAQLDGIGGETADLRRETRLAQKDRDDIAAKLQKERAEAEAAKEAFRVREAQLLEQIKNTKKQNRDLKSLSSMLETEAHNKPDSSIDEAGVQQLVAAKDRQVAAYAEQVEQLTKLNDTLNSQLRSQTREIDSLQSANEQLESVNQVLMEENESYQLLLQDKTMNGDFLDSAFMARTARERGMSLSFVRGPVSIPKHVTANTGSLADELGGGRKKEDDGREKTKEEYEKTVAELEKELQTAEDEIKALSLYISKIIGKLLADDKLEAALAQRVPDDDDERAAQRPAPGQAGKRHRGYSIRHSMTAMGAAGPGPIMIGNSQQDRRIKPSPLSQVTDGADTAKKDGTPSPTENNGNLDTPAAERDQPLLSPKPWLKRFSFFGKHESTPAANPGSADSSPRGSLDGRRGSGEVERKEGSPPPSRVEDGIATPPATPEKLVAPKRGSSKAPAFDGEIDLDEVEEVGEQKVAA
ncbi:hypothetical protein HK097_002869 [Rhizophlyctis rosea]|uniref:Uncharacterized protein n=1 Tax=Rhizophlyctis rosea TaxID=64517 RepID=A0AAD5X0D9_9FUNG|nr:hypothetical protein HK097_002869 [Rhizophlyctis rosea]